MSGPLTVNAQSFVCRDAGVTEVLLELDAAEYKLVKLYGVPLITAQGLFRFSYADDFALFCTRHVESRAINNDLMTDVDVSNRATTNAAFTFANSRCCFVIDNALECNVRYLYGVVY